MVDPWEVQHLKGGLILLKIRFCFRQITHVVTWLGPLVGREC